jgi:hemerythrin HHE cation binding domain-containing protein
VVPLNFHMPAEGAEPKPRGWRRVDHTAKVASGPTQIESDDSARRRERPEGKLESEWGEVPSRICVLSLTRKERRINAIELLKADHARVKALFRQYEGAGEQHAQQRELAEQILTEIEVHATVEEELFYPALRARLGQATTGQERANEETEDDETDDDETDESEEDLVADALEGHQDVKALIAVLCAIDPGDAQFQAKFAELREGVEEHVGMEEDELRLDAVAALGGELEPLGLRLEERKKQLMASKS